MAFEITDSFLLLVRCRHTTPPDPSRPPLVSTLPKGTSLPLDIFYDFRPWSHLRNVLVTWSRYSHPIPLFFPGHFSIRTDSGFLIPSRVVLLRRKLELKYRNLVLDLFIILSQRRILLSWLTIRSDPSTFKNTPTFWHLLCWVPLRTRRSLSGETVEGGKNTQC